MKLLRIFSIAALLLGVIGAPVQAFLSDTAKPFGDQVYTAGSVTELRTTISGLDDAITDTPGDLGLRYVRALALAEAGDIEKAGQDLQHVIAATSVIGVEWAELWQRRNRPAGAHSWKVAPEARALRAAALEAAAYYGARQEDFASAHRALEALLAMEPDNIGYLVQRGVMNRKLNNDSAAMRDHDAAIRRHEAAPQLTTNLSRLLSIAYLERARGFGRADDMEASLRDFEAAMALGETGMVVEAQTALREFGAYKGPVDGIWDEHASKALAACFADLECRRLGTGADPESPS